MRKNIIETISKYKKITNMVILTHNIDFLFLQTVVLSAVRKAGNPRLLILADAGCVDEAFQRQNRFLDGIGVRYRVIPVEMKPGFRFHPKLILSCGLDSAHLIVGSGNLTFGGWGENGELWSEFDNDSEFSGNIVKARELIGNILKGHQAESHLTDFLSEAFDSDRPWVSGLNDSSSILFKFKSEPTLSDQIAESVEISKFDELHVISPFYDTEGRALNELKSRFEVSTTKVFVPKRRSNISAGLAERLQSDEILNVTSFEVKDDETIKQQFVHAKALALLNNSDAEIFLGSANCSYAALLAESDRGNCEVMVRHTLSRNEYDEQILGELTLSSDPIDLSPEGDDLEEADNFSAGKLRIKAASYENGSLIVSYEAHDGMVLSGIIIDDEIREINIDSSPFSISVKYLPKTIQLIGNGDEAKSSLMWVDHEMALAANTAAISFASQLRDSLSPTVWGLEGYSQILKTFNENIKNLPKYGRSKITSGQNEKNDALSFSEDEIFGDLSIEGQFKFNQIRPSSGRNISLGNLILNWFGIGGNAVETDNPDRDDVGSDDMVDFEQKPSFKKKKVNLEKVKKKIQNDITSIADKFRAVEYFESRSPERFVSDIRIAAVLLRVGLKENWLSKEEYLDVTSDIWSSLFFRCKLDNSHGWISYYLNKSHDKEDDISRMRSLELSTAMSLWAHGIGEIDSASHSSFRLSSYLSVARHPWIWQGGKIGDVAKEIAQTVVTTDNLDEEAFNSFSKDFYKKWIEFLRRGYALGKLEEALSQYKVKELSEMCGSIEVKEGALLWQGPLGFAVVSQNTKLGGQTRVKIRTPQASKDETVIVSNLLVPLKDVLSSGALNEWEELDEKWKAAALEVVDELESLVSQGKF